MGAARGRPRRADRCEILQRVLGGLSQGMPLTVLAHQNGVHRDTIHAWKAEDPAFAQAYESARAVGWDHIAHQCLQIADEKSCDLIVDADGVVRPNIDAVRRAKLRVDTRLRLLAKWYSGYGKQRSVKVDANVVVTDKRRHVVDPRSLDEAGRAALRHLLAAAAAQGLIGVSADE